MSAGVATKIFAVCQPEKVSIPPVKDKISRLHCLSSGYSNR